MSYCEAATNPGSTDGNQLAPRSSTFQKVLIMSTSLDWIAETVAGLPPLVTAKEASTVLRTTTRNLRRHIAAGRIVAIRAEESGSSRVLFPRAEIARFLRACAGEVRP